MNITKYLHAAIRDDCPEECKTRWWMALAYYRVMDRKLVMVAWPLHYVWQAARWVEWKWGTYRHRPSWIDRHVEQCIIRKHLKR